MKAVILAGGYGTRLSEATNLIPKPMVEIRVLQLGTASLIMTIPCLRSFVCKDWLHERRVLPFRRR